MKTEESKLEIQQKQLDIPVVSHSNFNEFVILCYKILIEFNKYDKLSENEYLNFWNKIKDNVGEEDAISYLKSGIGFSLSNDKIEPIRGWMKKHDFEIIDGDVLKLSKEIDKIYIVELVNEINDDCNLGKTIRDYINNIKSKIT